MRRSSLIVCALVVTTSSACSKVKPQLEAIQHRVQQQIDLARQRFFKKKAPASSPVMHPVAQPAPPPPPPPPTTPAVAEPGHVTQQVATTRSHAPRDEPYVSSDTGTLFPGMSEKDVYARWGSPVAVRHMGEFTYLYFKNGCEYTCGHLDVVTLQNGQVTNALVRWPGHGFAGQSGSPTSAPSEAPPGGNTLQIAPPAAAPDSAAAPAPTPPRAPPRPPAAPPAASPGPDTTHVAPQTSATPPTE
ncbi:MAG TPA: hypothetical protein VLT79_05375 [Gemmatimonadales bacterium]|nr:hypothetical protein [Gemmatimonadales bacterium]